MQPRLTKLMLMMYIYEQQVLAYSEALGPYSDSLTSFTQWCDEDARAAAFLSQSVQPQFSSEVYEAC
jgi:hypothetical protein